MAEGQAKLQEKADVPLLNSDAHESICLISSTKGSVTYSWSDSLVGKVMGRKRQSSRDPLWEESSNLVLRDNYFDFFEWKKKISKWLILWKAAQIATEMQMYVDGVQNLFNTG